MSGLFVMWGRRVINFSLYCAGALETLATTLVFAIKERTILTTITVPSVYCPVEMNALKAVEILPTITLNGLPIGALCKRSGIPPEVPWMEPGILLWLSITGTYRANITDRQVGPVIGTGRPGTRLIWLPGPRVSQLTILTGSRVLPLARPMRPIESPGDKQFNVNVQVESVRNAQGIRFLRDYTRRSASNLWIF